MIPVNEIFETIQGEAFWTGTPSVFVRLQGCDVGCSFCDTKHTWKLEKKVSFREMIAKETDGHEYAECEIDELIGYIGTFNSKHIVITGGEPALYDLKELCSKLAAIGKTVQIETSGTEYIEPMDGVWITVSPKLGMAGGKPMLPEMVTDCSEVKYPVGRMSDIEALESEIIPFVSLQDVWLQPLSQSEKATELCIKQATANGWRLSMQTHKYIGVR